MQFHAAFPLDAATALVPYLAALGVGALYASPLLAARRGSTHGYDVTDPGQINPELGGEPALNRLSTALQSAGLGLVLDIVPNHMAASPENPWWRDVLELGEQSRYARLFDVNWRPARAGLRGRVLLPILGAPRRRVLQRGELQLALDAEGLSLRYYDWHLPLSPPSLRILLAPFLSAPLARSSGHGVEERVARLAEQVANLGPDNSAALAALQHELGQLYASAPALRALLDERLAAWNGQPGVPRSFARLDRLLGAQHYRLACWRVASRAINYRRFFDVSDLVSLRMEQPSTFEAVHALVGDLLARGQVTGLRIDHVDGLRDPLAYLRRLQRWAAERLHPLAPRGAGSTPGHTAQPCYVLVEKILTGNELLPGDWPVAGTTGYEFGALVTQLLVDAAGLPVLDAIYRRASGQSLDYAAIVRRQKTLVMDTLFAGERRALAQRLAHLARLASLSARVALPALERALTAVTAYLPVYRTYARDEAVPAMDRARIEQSVAGARADRAADPSALALVLRVLALDYPAGLPARQRRAWSRFVARWQQFTGPVTAKGVEDSAFYRYHRLIALNEVGADPDSRGVSVAAFHRATAERQAQWPHTLNATATHDTKRGEDVRARLAVLAELPASWAAHLARWQADNAALKELVDDAPVPDANTEILLYQTLLGAWPFDGEEAAGFSARVQAYARKAAREARAATSWLHPTEPWEAAQDRFIDRILTDRPDNRFLADFRPFQRRIAYFGAFNSLAQVLLKLTVPGVPDLYQGSELWDLSLVDPDNRRAVDYARRQRLLSALDASARRERAALIDELLANWQDGRAKLWTVVQALRWRRQYPALAAHGEYLPLEVKGARAAHVCAFARRHQGMWAVVVVPRLPARLSLASGAPSAEWGENQARLRLPAEVWEDTVVELPPGAPWDKLAVGPLLAAFPAVLLPGHSGMFGKRGHYSLRPDRGRE